MKKRKKPTALIITLVLFVVSAAGVNAYMQGAFDPLLARAATPNRPQLAEARKDEGFGKTAAKETSAKLRASKPTNPMSNRGSAAAAMRSSMGSQPLMAIPKRSAYRPTPNDSATSTQWYRTEAERPGN